MRPGTLRRCSAASVASAESGAIGGEQTAGSLWVEEQSAKFFGDAGRKSCATLHEIAVVFHATGEKSAASRFDCAGKIFHARVVQFHGDPAADGHFARVAEKRKTRDVCDGVNQDAASGACAASISWSASAASRFRRVIDAVAPATQATSAWPCFKAVEITPVPMGLVKIKISPGRAPTFFQIRLRMDHASDRVAEFQFIVANRMSANDGAIRFRHFCQAAAQDLLQNFGRAGSRKRQDGERGNRPAAHGIYIAERIGGGDLAEKLGIVQDRREKIHRLHDGEIILRR